MKQLLLTFLLCIVLSSCNSKATKDPELYNLVTLLIGEFSNKDQAINDSNFTHINLINVKIWEERPGFWIYSEVFNAEEEKQFYSQRIISYKRFDTATIVATNYEIPNAKSYRSTLKDPKTFEKLTADSLIVREGCEVYFKKKTSTIYSGKTKKGTCTSNISFIDHISSTFVVSKGKISVWTRGYDKHGKQVWGKIKGPYKYKKAVDR